MIEYLKEQKEVTESEETMLQNTVADIIKDVRQSGDEAMKKYLKKFDQIELPDIKVSQKEIAEAKKKLPQTLLEDMEFSIERITAFAEAQRATLTEFEKEMMPGVYLGQKVVPIESVGAYVPGGRYPLLSSAQMAIIPAKVAGVENVRVFTPPTKSGAVHPAVLYAAYLSGADEIFASGGAQAIAALAYGTESVNPVNKITGPGNRFVTEAKRQVNGRVGIDLLAGPSEILVLADDFANPTYVASDLLAQSEHDAHAQGILVTTSKEFGLKVLKEIEKQLKSLPTAHTASASWDNMGRVLYVDNIQEAIKTTNDLASEHLHVHLKDSYQYLEQLHNYGSLFLGEKSSVVYADKLVGTNHILPTKGAAKYTGGVWVGTFIKVVTYQHIEQQGVEQLAPHCVRQSHREGLIGHLRSANIRLTGELDAKPEQVDKIQQF